MSFSFRKAFVGAFVVTLGSLVLGFIFNVAYLLRDERDSTGRQLIEGEERISLAKILTKHGVKVPLSL